MQQLNDICASVRYWRSHVKGLMHMVQFYVPKTLEKGCSQQMFT